MSTRRKGILALFALALITFGPTLSGEFTNWDDPKLVRDNPAIRSLSPAALLPAFVPRAGETYQPLRVVSYAIDYTVWSHSPFGYRLGNLLLHALAAALLFLAFRQAIPRLIPSAERVALAAWIAAALFCLHPVNVEAVAWISSRKYGLLAVFAFSAWLAALSGKHRRAGGFCLAAALSSPFGIMVPGLLLVGDWASEHASSWRERLFRNVWALAVSMVMAPVLFRALILGDAAESTAVQGGSLLVRALTMIGTIPAYAINLGAPFWLSPRYPRVPIESPASAAFLVGAVCLVGAIIWALRSSQSGKRFPAFVCLWLAVALAPVSNLIAISTAMADRYLYLTAVPIWLIAGVALARVRDRTLRIMATSAVLLVCLGVAAQQARTWRSSVTLWQDALEAHPENVIALTNLGRALEDRRDYVEAEALFLKAVALQPQQPGIHSALAHVCLAMHRLQAAETHARAALALDPQFFPAQVNLCHAPARQGRPNEAIGLARGIFEQHGGGENWVLLGRIAQMNGDAETMRMAFERALELEPQNVQALNGCAMALLERKQLTPARELLAKAASIRADDPYVLACQGALALAEQNPRLAIDLLYAAIERGATDIATQGALAQALAAAGENEKAQVVTRSLTKQYPHAALPWLLTVNLGGADAAALTTAARQLDALFDAGQRMSPLLTTLGQLHLQHGRAERAVEILGEAARRTPDRPAAHNNLGKALARSGDSNGAVESFNEAIRLDPQYAGGHFNLGVVLVRLGKRQLGLQHLDRAVELAPSNSAFAAALAKIRESAK